MSTNPTTLTAGIPAPAPSAASREQKQIVWLIGGAIAIGSFLQIFIEPGQTALVVAAALAGATVFVMSQLMPGRWREVLSGFRFTSTLLIALAVASILGTLVLQNKPMEFYEARYGTVGSIIVALRLDDIFHSLWFAGLIALFSAAVVNSALMRFPLTRKNTGFFICHLGLTTSLLGAGVSAAFTQKGRVDLHAGGETAKGVVVTRNGEPTGAEAALGFDLRLDRFDLVRYEPEHRIAYYHAEEVRTPDGHRDMQFKLKASFDPEVGVRHLLPGGNSFQIAKLFPEYGNEGKEMKNPAATLEVKIDGEVRESPLLFAHQPGKNFIRVGDRGALVFEKRDQEVKAYVSHVTVVDEGKEAAKARVAVNDPFTYAGWTFYQVNYNPNDPTYSGFEAVKDPGVNWVFFGFFLISLGVAWMFYVDNRMKKAAKAA